MSVGLRRAATVVAAVLVAGCFVRFGVGADAVVGAALCTALVALSVTDLETRRIPNRIVLPAALLLLIARVATNPDSALEWPLAGIGAAAVLLVIALAYPAGLGMGDVKLALLLGFALGTAVAPALAVGFLASFVYSVVVLIRRGSAGWRAAFPLGPFLAFGGVVALLAS